MKVIVSLIFFLIIQIVKCQTIIYSDSLNSNNKKETSEIEVSYMDLFFEPYLNEINSIKKDSLYIPTFFYDVNFDLKDEILSNWYISVLDSSQYVSLRVELFTRINDVCLLSFIENKLKKDKTFNNIKRKPLPSDKYSNYELATMRRIEIQNGINILVTTGLTDPSRGSMR